MTLPMISLLSFLAGSLPLAVLLYLQARMHQERENQWMRIFSVHSLEIPKQSMDIEEDPEPTIKNPDTRKRLHIPLPIPDYAKRVYSAMKKGKDN